MKKTFGPFYRYDPNQCILCGRCVEVCQDVQVNETLSIDWEREQPELSGITMYQLMNHHVLTVVNVQQFVHVMP